MSIRSPVVRLGYAALRAGASLPEIRLLDRFNQQASVRDLLRKLQVNCVLDVGANVGLWATQLRMLGYTGHIFCFEPIPENYKSLMGLSGRDPKVHPINVALGTAKAQMEFQIIRTPATGTGLSSFFSHRDSDLVGETTVVDVERLDAILDDLLAPIPDPRVFLKIDTQGYDVEVLKGAEGSLGPVVLLQSEISVTPVYDGMPHYTAALDYFESLGFVLMNLFGVARGPDGRVLEYDCLMVRADQLGRPPFS